MGIYTTNCSNCDEPYPWFSGNTETQICSKCFGSEKERMNNKPQSHLESIISLQAEIISMLKAEIERLKLSKVIVPNGTAPTSPGLVYPGAPQPSYPGPGVVPYQPWPQGPLTPPYVITSGDIQPTGGAGHVSISGTVSEVLTQDMQDIKNWTNLLIRYGCP